MARWYVDNSAVTKLITQEPETVALGRWLETHPWVVSDLHRTELRRASRRAGPGAPARAERLLSGVEILEMPSHVFDQAGLVGPPTLRSLDALHLAAALTLGPDLAGIVAYDQRLLAAATDLGIPVASPA